MPAKFPLSKFKVELKLASNRLRFLQEKQAALNTKARRTIATLLEAGKVASATVRVEGIIRDDLHVEAMEIVELFCELLCTRAGLIDQLPTVDQGLSEAVSSVIYASTRIEARELPRIRDLLAAKYGKDVVVNAMDNADGFVNAKLLQKLSLEPPSERLVRLYLKEIAAAYRVDWRPDDNDDDEPGGGIKELSATVPTAPPSPAQAAAAEQDPADGTDRAQGEVRDEDQVPAKNSDSDAVALPSIPEHTADSAISDIEPASSPVLAKAKVPAVEQPKQPASRPVLDKGTTGDASGTVATAASGPPTMEELQRRFDALRQL
ncbi:Vacuolar protein sorting-associated protein ist1 [Coemansia biformis]|uniref:Vacuolar protein sorting-associated protein ist1 n=1 Tax=Coemansia biformis TaxID=1286918 RepID=A0A9W7YCJ4_9FUNG|nr:Vacuolar protein sorting-associated protein ist1 [Coemansia biformis]